MKDSVDTRRLVGLPGGGNPDEDIDFSHRKFTVATNETKHEAWHFCPEWDRRIRGACWECRYCNKEAAGD